MILALYERLRVAEAEGFDHIHGLVEATKRAFRVRDKVVTDPGAHDRPAAAISRQVLPRRASASRSIAARRRRGRRAGAMATPIWMGAADSSGLVVSYIQSLYWEFGSGVVLPATGVLMQNRGASFSLDPRALNTLAPGRLPFHTLNPALAVLNDGRVMAYGTMGGDGQPQSQAALFTRHVLYRQPLDAAIDAPRWLLGRTWGSTITNLRMESRFDGNLIDQLAVGGPRRRCVARGLFRHHGSCRRGDPASQRHAGGGARSARGRRRGGVCNIAASIRPHSVISSRPHDHTLKVHRRHPDRHRCRPRRRSPTRMCG